MLGTPGAQKELTVRLSQTLIAFSVLATTAGCSGCASQPSTSGVPTAADGRTASEAKRSKRARVSEKTARAREEVKRGVNKDFGQPPPLSTGPLPPDIAQAVDVAFGDELRTGRWSSEQTTALRTIAKGNDLRPAWLIADLLRITYDSSFAALLSTAAQTLMKVELDKEDIWRDLNNHLIAWDVPAPPGYLRKKRDIYTLIVPEWEKLFTEGSIDWRHVSWGGVRIDDRPFGKTDERCNCIPAADNPPVTDAANATWLDDDEVVFGVSVGGEHRAYPRPIMEVREMVNDTLGGRQLGIPYCTLCASAQAYFTDRMPAGVERPVLRTSGLLIRSNKVMYDLNTFSVFDTFRGNAVTGPLAKRKIRLEQAGVVTTRWADWKKAHPDTTVLVERLALGQNPDFRNGRDAEGPIFPIGDVDARLPVQADVVGVVTAAGHAVAFPVESAKNAIQRGEIVTFEEIQLVLDGGGLRATNAEGQDVGAHQAFWFAWSQFYPGTALWSQPL